MEGVSLPDYYGGSIVNLMSSIAQSFGAKTGYKPLKILPPNKIRDARNVVLLIIDGLGYDYLRKKGKGSVMQEHLIGEMTSVFPPTTAAAVTTFLTGVAPQQHALTGWFMHLKEVGVVSAILPFRPRFGGFPLTAYGIPINTIFGQKSFFSKINAQKFFINPKEIAYSDFSKTISGNAKILPYTNLGSFFRQVRRAINSSKRKKFINAYWPGLDGLSHTYGVEHKKCEKHFKEIDKKLRRFIKTIKGTNTLLIVTADHGLTNTPIGRLLRLEDHPKMQECLTLPLCGEARTAYCYVHPEKKQQFENYVNKNLSKYCYLFRSQDLISKNYFGLFKPNPKLFDRIGDYALLFKKDYALIDSINAHEKNKKPNIGHHGGISREEMIVPLIIIRR
ncbi:alkaline phosphatase family protein [Candidatus Woesearchaeota archaeon]|nr:alkaline phosphatase family protein [Candidatus Woesearchaeota archaeon]